MLGIVSHKQFFCKKISVSAKKTYIFGFLKITTIKKLFFLFNHSIFNIKVFYTLAI